MNNVIGFNTKTILNNTVFYEYIWNRFYQIAFVAQRKYIVLDLSNITIVKPEVLPKLCCLGVISKRYGIKIEINLDPLSKSKEFLGDIGFFNVVEKNELFILNEGQIGGKNEKSKVTNAFLCFDSEFIMEKYKRKFVFDNRIGEADRLKYCIEAEIFGENYILSPGIISEEMIIRSPILSVLAEMCDNVYIKNQFLNDLGLDFTELIHNSLWHGENKCFFSVQSGTYCSKKDEKFKRIDICIADSGIGLYESLRKKKWRESKKETCTLPIDKMLSLDTEKDRNYYSILEMIYYRAEDMDRGVYDIMKNLVGKKRLAISIINKNIQMYLNNDNLAEVLTKKYKRETSINEKKSIGYGFSIDISFSM